MIKNNAKSGRLDFLGSVISITCAIHCLLLPLLVSAGSLMALVHYDHELIEALILLPSVMLCTWSVTTSYKLHKRMLPFVLFALSLCAIALARWTDIAASEVVLNTTGAVLIAITHMLNRKLRKAIS